MPVSEHDVCSYCNHSRGSHGIATFSPRCNICFIYGQQDRAYHPFEQLSKHIIRGVDWAFGKDQTVHFQYDEASEVTPEMWEKLRNRPCNVSYAEQYQMSKKQREFIETPLSKHLTMYTGGYSRNISFLNILRNFLENTKMPNLTDQEKRFVTAGGVIPSVPPVKPLDNGQHYSIVLRHDNPNTWVSADGRETSIAIMVDQHLINTMRFLIRNFEPIRHQYLVNVERLTKIAEVDYANNLVVMLNNEEKRVRGMKSSAVFFTATIAPFETLAEEVVRRFGQRALRAIYDGE
jgi:hypothetical protein